MQESDKARDHLRSVMSLAQRGDLVSARGAGEQALAAGAHPPLLWAMLGAICCQMNDFEAGIDYLRRANRAQPSDVTVAMNLATALAQQGDLAGALMICTPALAAADPTWRLLRLRAYLLQSLDDYIGAAGAYEQVVAAVPTDFESWNNLGNARAAIGDDEGSLEALARAAQLCPESAPVRLNLATTLVQAGRFDQADAALSACARDFATDPNPLVELAALRKRQGRMAEAVEVLGDAAARAPTDVALQTKLAIERLGEWDIAGGEVALARALAVAPAHAEAHLHRALMMEHTNRGDQISGLADQAAAMGVDPITVAFIRALGLRRHRRWRDCLDALRTLPDTFEPSRVWHLRGQCHDRLGEPEAAFQAFVRMNQFMAEDPSEPLRRAAESRAALREDRALVTPAWRAGWRDERAEAPERSPVFLVGFPRSGTTLLDTMLMGHPDVQVMEEEPALNHVDRASGWLARLPTLSDADIAELRRLYFHHVREAIELRPGTLLVDKSPLHMNKVPLITRLFPGARFILALRHPCDVVLSCFSTNFRLNNAMSNFLELAPSADFYDLSFDHWESCREIMDVAVHEISYERMVTGMEDELRSLFGYLGLHWVPRALDHQQTAAERGIIPTASYAQVTEPLYTRSSGRWVGYRSELEPVLGILAPWCRRFGYTL